jgi:hypothetical protein
MLMYLISPLSSVCLASIYKSVPRTGNVSTGLLEPSTLQDLSYTPELGEDNNCPFSKASR